MPAAKRYRLKNKNWVSCLPMSGSPIDFEYRRLPSEGTSSRFLAKRLDRKSVKSTDEYGKKQRTFEESYFLLSNPDSPTSVSKDIDRAEYENLYFMGGGITQPKLYKTRHLVPCEGRMLALDVYTSDQPACRGLRIVEVDAADESTPLALPPIWELEDITNDPRYLLTTLIAS